MKYSENPTVDFKIERKIETADPAEFVAFLESVPADAPAAWYSHKDQGAHPGVWVRRGHYRLKHGSFVDPADLSAYAAQYYEPFESGRHEAVQIGRTPARMAMPADVTPTPTAAELARALRELVPLPVEEEPADEAAAEGEAPEAAAAEAVESATTPEGEEATQSLSERLISELKFLQPDYAFEFHGALTRGWHAQFYATEPAEEDAAPEYLLVLR